MAEKPTEETAKAMLRAIAGLSDDELAYLGRRIKDAKRNREKEREEAIANGWN